MSSVPGFDSSAFSLLQQQLITANGRLDRQVQQLTRLNRLSNRLLDSSEGGTIGETFAEAVVDVLDTALGAVWVLAPDTARPDEFAICGSIDLREPQTLGAALAEAFVRSGTTGAVRPEILLRSPIGLDAQCEGLVCPCIGRDGSLVAVILAATNAVAAEMGAVTIDDAGEMLAVLAEKCAVAIDDRAAHDLLRSRLEQLRESEERLELVLRGTNDGWWDWDLMNGSCFYSARWLEMLGHHHDDAWRGRDAGFWADLIHPDDRDRFDTLFQRATTGEHRWLETELRLECSDGGHLPVLVRGTVSLDADGQVTRFAGSVLDLTERKVHEERIHRLAFYDPLTDLPNRRLLLERLRRALDHHERTGQLAAVLMLDVDRFKTLNDTHGHAAGDELLKVMGSRITASVRARDTVARLSGDEFVVLLEDLGTDRVAAGRTAEKIAEEVRLALDAPCSLMVGPVHFSVSIGLDLVTDKGVTVEVLMKHADMALYEAKAAGRNTVRRFQPAMQRKVADRSALEAKLRESMNDGEFTVHYQPLVDHTGALFAAEALMRWNPRHMVGAPPSEFIPVAEESGLIHALGQWRLSAVCEQLMRWSASLPPDFRVAVNLSAAEFLHPELTDRIVGALQSSGVPGHQLRLELTEATVVTDLAFAAERMTSLRQHGVEFSLDDFGTGYSSLTYLRRLPVSEVKIDRSYVHRMLHDPDDEAIVKAVITLCHALDLRVVAEGVETLAQRQRLLDLGCRCFQGFLFGVPQAAPPSPGELVQHAIR